MDMKKRIKALRLEEGMSQAQLAKKFGKTEGAVRTWEKGTAKPDVEILVELSEYFNCTTDYLLGLSNYRNADEKNKIEGLLSELETSMAGIRDREKCLEILVEFLNAVPESDRQEIAESLFGIVHDFTSIFEILYKLLDDFEDTKFFDYERLLKYYKEIDNAKNNLHFIFDLPIQKIRAQSNILEELLK